MICEEFALSGGVTSINKAGALDGMGSDGMVMEMGMRMGSGSSRVAPSLDK